VSDKPQAWITGAGGLIGNYLIQTAQLCAPQFQPLPLTRQILELTDADAVARRFANDRPALIIHCAAMSRSPDCQASPALARKVNVDVTTHLAQLAADMPFLFFSSDLVFDGRNGNYIETDAPNPLSIYGETKLAAEQIVLRNPRHTVIRTSLNGGRSPKGNQAFNEDLRATWQAGKAARLFSDEFRCPIPSVVTARAIWDLVRQDQTGLYHLAGSEKLSRVEIGNLVAARCPELNPRIEVCSLRDYQGAPRPADASLICDKIQKVLSFQLPGLTRWLSENPHEFF
jgi:dTDP-4-dehydrorhamnose reductase